MAKRKAKDKILEEFFLSGDYVSDNDYEMEQDLQAFAKSKGYDISAYGSGIDEHDLGGSARYTRQVIDNSPKLSRMYNKAINGDYAGNRSSNNNYDEDLNDGLFNRIVGSFGIHPNNIGSNNSNNSNNRNNRSRSDDDSGERNLPNFKIGWIFAFIIGLVLLYKIVGPVVYGIIMSGVLLKIIFFVVGGLITYKVLVSKNMGWPIYIKIAVLGTIWLVLLNYNW